MKCETLIGPLRQSTGVAPPVDLSPDQTQTALTACMIRQAERGEEIFYGAVWRKIARTDLMDDIRTWSSDCKAARYVGKATRGARITDTHFFVIDCYSDG